VDLRIFTPGCEPAERRNGNVRHLRRSPADSRPHGQILLPKRTETDSKRGDGSGPSRAWKYAMHDAGWQNAPTNQLLDDPAASVAPRSTSLAWTTTSTPRT